MRIMSTSRASERIQVLLDPETKRAFEDTARREGLSLSAWLREAGLERSAGHRRDRRFQSARELEAFFAECAERESGREPDWEEHKAAVAGAMSRGGSDT